MRVTVREEILYIHRDDVPTYKKSGAVTRNTYFWALRSIADRALRGKDWEFDRSVWIALCRMLLSFAESGYLGFYETTLEFDEAIAIPEELRACSTSIVRESSDAERS
ncbi:MAG: hypothetical protein J7641_22320 [Cyanobacteria bacterium SID2]|nr:hypothetical protein [Cyanobacteria bacterium SID2]MBP0004481.1 hypothetical protein [Cyanobacteria bacterium SBC]